MLRVTKMELPDVLLLEYSVSKDNRAEFHRTYSKEEMWQAGIQNEFVEEIAYHVDRANTVYGIHYQNHPKAQAKLVYCAKGRILDFAVDLRKSSATYKKWVSVELSRENKRQIFLPAGFGHAALTLEEDTCIVMRIDQRFDPSLSGAIQFNDPDIGILADGLNPVLSEQDRIAPPLIRSECNL